LTAACGSDDDVSSDSSSTASTSEVASTTLVVAASTTMSPEPADELGVDEAAQIVDGIAATFELAEFSRVEELLGEDGVWIATTGDEYDRSTIGAFLEGYTDQSGIGSYLVDLVRADEAVEGLGGHGFKMTETLSNGTEVTFWIFVARDEDGALTVTERFSPPRG
jgi:hypothetical protein